MSVLSSCPGRSGFVEFDMVTCLFPLVDIVIVSLSEVLWHYLVDSQSVELLLLVLKYLWCIFAGPLDLGDLADQHQSRFRVE